MKKSTLIYLLKLLAGPLIALALYMLNPFHLEELANNTISIGAWMIIWWILESIPMPAVALMPLLFFPILKISTIEKTAQSYSNPVIFLFMGGFMIGLAIEKWHLHKRIALQIIRFTGTSGKQIILGFILACGFLSMWLSNTATTMMMFPIALSVIHVMQSHVGEGKNMNNFSLVLMLVIAYASNIGGMATIIGTPPNVAFAAYIEKTYQYNIQFGEWMLVCFPLAIVLLFAIYWILAFVLFPVNIRHSNEASDFVKNELKSLGPISTAEKRVMFVFCMTALLWIFKDLINRVLPFAIDDTQIALLGMLSLFIIPAGHITSKSERLLEWSDTSKMAWGILLLFGGGIALASALESAGIIQKIGNQLAGIGGENIFLLLLIIVTLSVFLSELMSNVAQVIVFAPVIGSLSDALHISPLILGIPMTLAASAAAMLPMGTPPNAIVFGSGYIPLKKMMKAGFVINLICILTITLFCFYFLPFIIRNIQH